MDESRFSLMMNDGRARVWRAAGERFLPECQAKFMRNSPASVMVWGYAGLHGVGNLVFLEENVTAAAYVRALDENLFTSVQNFFGDRVGIHLYSNMTIPRHTQRGLQSSSWRSRRSGYRTAVGGVGGPGGPVACPVTRPEHHRECLG